MKRYTFSALLLVLGASISITGCFDEVSGPYDGPDVAAFAENGVGGLWNESVGFSAGSEETESIELEIELIAEQSSSDQTVEVVAVEPGDEGEAEACTDTRAHDFTAGCPVPTAVLEEHFELTSGSDITIPANESHGYVELDIFGDALEDGESVAILLRLNETGDLDIAENYRYFHITASKSEEE